MIGDLCFMSGFKNLYETFRQPYVLNIFCDASLKHRGEESDICYGSVAVNKDNILDSIYRINTSSTSNRGEAQAILAGLYLANKFKDKYSVINIFSDSQISILNLRERYKNWEYHDGDYYIKSGGVLANQDIYSQIIKYICDNDLEINFFHQKGHVNDNKFSDIMHATDVFAMSNRLKCKIDYSFIRYISKYNNIVDAHSRSVLLRMDTIHNKFISPCKFMSTKETLDEYKERKIHHEWNS